MRNQSQITNHQSLVTNHQSPQNAIVLQNVSKKYSLTKERPILLKNLFAPPKEEEVWALKNISLNIKKGECIGIIGENGSGKSTLLKIIAGITTPTKGSVEVNGKVGSLIELGAGFHPDLTGKENVYLNGMLLGFAKKELDKKYREIVEFADIGEYIDQPVRTYSSGMTVRLGFSVAIHLDPEILLIDEVLAVGDEEFQRKCIRVINEFKKLGKTILFISHNLFLITSLCQKVLLLNHGKREKFGWPVNVVDFYLHIPKGECNDLNQTISKIKKKISIKSIEFLDRGKSKKFEFTVKDPLAVILKYKNTYGSLETSFGLAIYNNEHDYLYGFSTDPILTYKGEGRVKFLIRELPPIKGKLIFTFDIADLVRTIRYDAVAKPYAINVIGKSTFHKGLVDYMCDYNHSQKITSL